MRRSLGLVLAVAFVAACSDGAADDERSTETTVEVSTTTSTATTLATTTTVSFELEVRRAAVELLEIRNEVLMNPNVSRVSEYISDTCVCLERERGIVERFVAEGLRWTVRPVEVRGVELTVSDPTDPGLTVVAYQPAGAVVRSDGSVFEEVEASDASAYSVVLLRDADGAWRVNGLEGISLNEATIVEVLGAGLP